MRNRAKSLPWLTAMLVVVASAAAQHDSRSLPPQQLVAKAVQNEIAANSNSGLHFMFKNERKTAHLSQVKWICETRDATVGMLVAQDGHPLSPQQQQAEKARLQNYINNRDELERKRKQEKEDADRTEKIIKAMPQAFLYEAAGTEKGTASVGHPGDDLVRLNFRPNPNYQPPSHVEQVLTGMQGHILIDQNENRIAEIDGTLEKEVGFGWGILGHLDRGGRFLVQQADVGNRNWEATRMELSFTGKILLFKKLNIHSTDIFTDFRQVPGNLTFAQGVQLVEKEAARGGGATRATNSQAQAAKTEQSKNAAKDPEEPLCCDR